MINSVKTIEWNEVVSLKKIECDYIASFGKTEWGGAMSLEDWSIDNIIEPVKRIEWSEVMSLWERSVKATQHFIPTEDIMRHKERVRQDYIPTYKLFCTKSDNGKIVGVVGIGKDNMLELLFVDPSLMRKGVGKALLEYVIQNFDVSRTEVNESNKSAKAFYKQMGFRVVDRYESGGYPTLLMEL
jgi:putative acetyltransferase